MLRYAKKLCRSFGSDRQGGPSIEFAIVAPLLFLIVLGTFETGRALYTRNEIAAAAAAGARAIAITGPADETAIRSRISDKLSRYDTERLNVAISNTTIAGSDFKKIEITYDFEPLVNLGSHLSNVTITATRYAPAVNY